MLILIMVSSLKKSLKSDRYKLQRVLFNKNKNVILYIKVFTYKY